MKFKLLVGTHAHGDKVYHAGKEDIVETKIDLTKLHGPRKFQRIYGEAPSDVPPETSGDNLDDLTVVELRGIADDMEVDLGEAKKKADIIAVIRKAQE